MPPTRQVVSDQLKTISANIETPPALLLVLTRPLQAEFVKFGAKVHEGGDWHQPFEQVERVK